MLQDEFAVAGYVAVELKAWLVRNLRLKQLFTPDEFKAGDIPAADMQEIEGVGKQHECRARAAWVWAKFGNPALSTPQSSPSI
jgi:hypothetical protein